MTYPDHRLVYIKVTFSFTFVKKLDKNTTLKRAIYSPNFAVMCFYVERRSASFLLVHSGAALHGHVMDTFATNSNTVCSLYCARDLNCKSYNYDKEEGNCELNDDLSAKNAQGLVPNENVDYYEKLDLYYPRL